MKRVINLVQSHPVEVVAAVMVGGIMFLVAMRLLRIRLGFPAIAFACLLVILAGAGSFGYLQLASKGILRWVALAVMGGLVIVYLPSAERGTSRLTMVHWGWIVLLAFAYCLVPFSSPMRFAAMSSVAISIVFIAAFGTIWCYTSNPGRLVELADVIFKLALGVVCLGFLFAAVPGIQTSVGSRFQGFFNNPNWNGNFSAIILPVVLWKGRYARNRMEGYVAALLGGLLCVNILLAGSRGAIVMAFVAGMLAQYRLDRAKLIRHVSLIIPVLVLAVLTQAGHEYLESHTKQLARVERVKTLTHRTEMWAESWPAIRKNLPLGSGLGNSRFILLSDEERKDAATEVGAVAAHLHSQHILMLAELGVPGLMLLWAFIMHVCVIGVQLWRYPKSPMADLGFALFCSCLVVFGDSFLHGWMLSAGSAYALLFWMIVSLMLKSERYAWMEIATASKPVGWPGGSGEAHGRPAVFSQADSHAHWY